MLELYIVIGLIWVVAGLLGYGLAFAYLSAEFGNITKFDKRSMIFLSFLGPLFLFSLAFSGFFFDSYKFSGFKYKED